MIILEANWVINAIKILVGQAILDLDPNMQNIALIDNVELLAWSTIYLKHSVENQANPSSANAFKI